MSTVSTNSSSRLIIGLLLLLSAVTPHSLIQHCGEWHREGVRQHTTPGETTFSNKQSGQNWAHLIFMVPLLPAWRAHAQTEGGPNFHLTPVSWTSTMDDNHTSFALPNGSSTEVLPQALPKITKEHFANDDPLLPL